MIFFYFVSILWHIAYYKLICTDITNYNFPGEKGEPALVCKYCKTLKRRDIIHCNACGTCNAYHDHHCGVVAVCVCGANYKFFVQFILYSGTLFVMSAVSVAMISIACNNDMLAAEMVSRSVYIVIGFIIFSLIYCGLGCMFACDNIWPRSSRSPIEE
jgi:hypothetical protein